MHRLSRLFVAGLLVAPVSGQAGEFAQTAPVPGMALTPPDPGMANGPPTPAPGAAAPAQAELNLPVGRRRLHALGSGLSSIEGHLPNQRTGPRHEHVVRDICIGC